MIGVVAEKVIALRKNNPCMNIVRIADTVGVSRQRVSQILQRAKLRTGAYREPIPFVEVACTTCGKFKTITQRHLIYRINRFNQQHFFCSRECSSKWEGHGFRFHPRQRQYDYDLIWRIYQENKKSLPELARGLQIPYSTLSLIIRTGRKQGLDKG